MRVAGLAGLGLLAALAACGGGESATTGASGAWFVEDAGPAGLDFVHVSAPQSRFWFPEIMAGGVALVDFDGDGWLDVYLVQGGDLARPGDALSANRLYRNLGTGAFADVSEGSGADDRGYGMGVAVGDYDRDGDPDLYVTNVGANALLRNEGDGTFTEVGAQAGVDDAGWGVSAAFADLDSDGWLDLVVVNYLEWSPETELECKAADQRRDYCHPNSYDAPAADRVWRNREGAGFEDVTEAWGFGAARGNGLGVVCGDLDGDGDTDVYVANDMRANQLWINGGPQARPRFEDRALLAGCALSGAGTPESGMGVAARDLDGDGRPELFVSHMRDQTNTLYHNVTAPGGAAAFDDATAMFGLAAPSLPFTGFGLGFADFDQDGRDDLFVANGRVSYEEPLNSVDDPYAEPNQLFTPGPDGRFAELLPRGGVTPPLVATTRGAAFGDLDGDGDLDVVLVNKDERVHLLRNRVGGRGGWLRLAVLDERGSPAIGARVSLQVAGLERSRVVDPAWSYASSNDPRLHFGLGAAQEVEGVRVRWPDGTAESFGSLAGGREHVLQRGRGSGD